MYIKQKIILKRVGNVEREITSVFSIAAFGNAELQLFTGRSPQSQPVI